MTTIDLCRVIMTAGEEAGNNRGVCVLCVDPQGATITAETVETKHIVTLRTPHGLPLEWLCQWLGSIADRAEGYEASIGCFTAYHGITVIPLILGEAKQ